MVTTLSIRFPKNRKFAACFTYDFDAMSAQIGTMKRTDPASLSQGEFGAVGARRILDLLDKYSVKATFFTPGFSLDTFTDLAKEIHQKGHEIGHHGYMHERPSELDLEGELAMLRNGNAAISRIAGSNAKGYRAPAWSPGKNTIDLLLQEGFLYDSSLMAHDYLPYLVRRGDAFTPTGPFEFGKDYTLIELPVAWSLDDYPHFELSPFSPGLKAASGVLENWRGDFDYMVDNVPGGVYSICFHPQVSGRGHRMVVMEKLLQHILEREDVWVTRMVDVAYACSGNRNF